jgi:hypothetical protein
MQTFKGTIKDWENIGKKATCIITDNDEVVIDQWDDELKIIDRVILPKEEALNLMNFLLPKFYWRNQ